MCLENQRQPVCRERRDRGKERAERRDHDESQRETEGGGGGGEEGGGCPGAWR